ncbi:MAG TPA: extracellular solute-binding protein [Gaiellaceae bacterium]
MHARISRRVAVLLTLLVAVATALTAATVGSSAIRKPPPPIPAKLKADIATSSKIKNIAQREKALEQMAENEGGQLNVYTSLSSLIVKAVQKQWATDFPNIKLNLFRGSSEDVTARVVAERKAHPDNGVDVIETNGTNMLFFQHFKDTLIPYTKSPYRANVAKAYRFDTFTADRLEKFVVAWNTNLVQGADVPKSWNDLANPKWKGKLAMEPTDDDWFAAMYEYLAAHGGKGGKKMSTAALNKLWRGIASNAQLIPGHTAESTALAAGQVAIVVSGHAQSLENLMQQKAPLAFSPFIKPIIERPQGVGISYWAPHPGAALLFYDWLLSPEVQNIMNANGVAPANTTVAADTNFANTGSFTIHMDLRPIVSHIVEWQKKYESFTRLGQGG